MSRDPPLLDHEKLDVYGVAVEFFALALRILGAISRRSRELRSQLERAAMSVPLNIAEGCGKPEPEPEPEHDDEHGGRARGTSTETRGLVWGSATESCGGSLSLRRARCDRPMELVENDGASNPDFA